jgi:hypothetical protein
MVPLLLALLIAAAPAGNRVRLPPVDQCAADPAFRLFRAELDQAIAARDAGRLLALAGRDIEVSFGGERGHDDFRRTWKLDRPETSPLWQELAEVLALGCATDGTIAVAPSHVNQLPSDYDIFDTMIAVRPGATLRARPKEKAKKVATLDWDIVRMGSWDGTGDWIPVTLGNGRSGFVRREHVRSVIDYRATFEKVDGKWLMTTFLAGD